MTVTRFAVSQPGWVWRGTLGVAAFILALPLILLVMLALLTAALVFGVLALIASAIGRVQAMLGRDHAGRQNVRVIVRRD